MRALGFLLLASSSAFGAVDSASLYKAAEAKLKDVPPAKELEALSSKPEKAAVLVRANQEALALFKRAAAGTSDGYLFGPKVDKVRPDTPMPTYVQEVALVKLLVLEARLHQAAGRFSAAEENLLAVAGFMGHLSVEGSNPMIAFLVEALALEKSFAAFGRSIREASSPAYLKELSLRLSALDRSQDFLKSAFLGESKMSMGTIALIEDDVRRRPWRSMFDKEFFAELNRLYGGFNDALIRAMLLAAEENSHEAIQAMKRGAEQTSRSAREKLERRGVLAHIGYAFKGPHFFKMKMAETLALKLAAIKIPPYWKVIERYHFFYNQLGVLRCAAAVERYRRDRGRLPEDLGRLVPAYLPSVPPDTFAGRRPLRFKRTAGGFTVYGVGPDRGDDGGSVVCDWGVYYDAAEPRKACDIAFSDPGR